MSDQIEHFRVANDLLGEPDALRESMEQNGYLFFTALVPASALNQLCNDVLAICQDCHWATSNGRANGEPRLEGTTEFWEVYDRVQSLERFHTLAHCSELLDVAEALVQEPPLVHPRNIARITFPQTEHFTTPAHQDYVHIQAAPNTYTSWMPLHNCARTLGSIIVLAGSHQFGVLPVHKANSAGGLETDTKHLNLTWHGSDFRLGDVLMFHSHTVHKALPNQSYDQLRLSVDYRYQGSSQPIVEDGLEPHYSRLTWEQIYHGWRRQELQFYWRNLPLTVVARDSSYHRDAHEHSDAASR